MTEQHTRHVGGKGFKPSERNVADSEEETAATTTHGSGKQFAKDVGDPETDEDARQTEGSGKQFAWDVEEQDPDEEARDEHAKGSGKQFEPGRHES